MPVSKSNASPIEIQNHPCPSVKSVVKDFLTTDGTEKHGWGAVTRIQELQRELVA